jgi:hypothetical protein
MGTGNCKKSYDLPASKTVEKLQNRLVSWGLWRGPGRLSPFRHDGGGVVAGAGGVAVGDEGEVARKQRPNRRQQALD